jgi:hypothetical protein
MSIELKTIEINGEEYVRKTDVQEHRIDLDREALRIIVNNDRGLCIVGNVCLDGDDEFVTIKNGRCIIKWGTTAHLAELAANGPMGNTTFGYKHDHIINRSAINIVLNCDVSKWEGK